jgi:hypothetical protein
MFDTKRPHIKLDREKDPDYVEQDALIYAWSESNVNYEVAWWFYPGSPSSQRELLRDQRLLPPNVSPEAFAKLDPWYTDQKKGMTDEVRKAHDHS